MGHTNAHRSSDGYFFVKNAIFVVNKYRTQTDKCGVTRDDSKKSFGSTMCAPVILAHTIAAKIPKPRRKPSRTNPQKQKKNNRSHRVLDQIPEKLFFITIKEKKKGII